MPAISIPTGRRLGALFLGYLLAVVAVIALAPFQFAVPDHFTLQLFVPELPSVLDVLLNVALFLPIGFVWHRMVGARPIWALAIGLLCGVLIEGAQLFLAPRYSTVSDLVANAIGCWYGARASRMIARHVSTGAMVSRLWLDQPMMGLVYLLIPLLWLHALGASDEPARLWLLVPLGMAGALIITAVATVTSLEFGTRGRAWPMIAALGWYLVGAVPAFRIAPVHAGWGAVITVITALLGGKLWRMVLTRERRLEPQLVRALFPFIVVVVVGTSIDAGSLWFEGSTDTRIDLLRALAQIATFTLLGYLIAESRGRQEEPLLRALVLPVIVAAIACAGLAVMAIEWPSVMRVLACVLGAGYGAVLYDAQRAHVVALRAGA